MNKSIIKKAIRIFLHVLWLLPVRKNKIFFISFQGSTIGCSPYYIFNKLAAEKPELSFVWCCNKDENYQLASSIAPKTKFVKQHSFNYLLTLLTSKIIINNSSCPTWIPYRKKQIIINTWHGGGAYKKVAAAEFKTKEIIAKEQQSAKDTTYFITSCKKFTEVMKDSTFVPIEKFLPIGLPRNDIFFNPTDTKKANDKVRNTYNLKDDDYIVLFAPTYRGSSMNASDFSTSLNIQTIRNSIEKKFNKKPVILYRGHYFFTADDTINQFDINVSDYPIMQELLCTADLLITDYSSSMWDFGLTNKLCVLYAPDLDEYTENRGFYTEPENWGFPIAKTNDEFSRIISDYNPEDYSKKLAESYNFFESYEQGHATEKIIDKIKEILV